MSERDRERERKTESEREAVQAPACNKEAHTYTKIISEIAGGSRQGQGRKGTPSAGLAYQMKPSAGSRTRGSARGWGRGGANDEGWQCGVLKCPMPRALTSLRISLPGNVCLHTQQEQAG